MGVDLLGFATIEGQEGYIKPVRFQEIRGWVTGPKIVAEVYGLKNAAQIEGILHDYKPDYLEMGLEEWSLITTPPIPVILSVEDADQLESLSVSPAYLIGDKSIDTTIPFLIRVNSPRDVELILQDPNIKGMVLRGGTELKPGLKDTEMINEVLELLETDE
jgi:phosphoribosylanthranilate isomerase